MIFKAIAFAAQAHTGQYRKGTKIPYISHPLNVAETLIRMGCSEQVVIAGLLHDTLEDTPVTEDTVQEMFGRDIALLVKSVSEPSKREYAWEERKAHTLKHLEAAPWEVLILSLADKLDNIRSIQNDHAMMGEQVWLRFKRPREKQQWYYKRLAGIFSERLIDDASLPLVSDYCALVRLVFDDGRNRA